MIPKNLSDITATDLNELVVAKRAEGRQIDYKSDLPGGSDEQKRNFLADVTAMANTLGGDIIYGVVEEIADGRNTGIPAEIRGVRVDSHEQKTIQLEQIARTAVDPRISGLSFRWIPHPSSEQQTLVLRVHKSLVGPHMVTYGGLSRFYGRATGGNFQMDVREIRASFEASGDLSRRLQGFRAERIAQVHSDLPVKLPGRGRLFLHVLPIAYLLGPTDDLTSNQQQSGPWLRTIAGSTGNSRYNLDGQVFFEPNIGYALLFRGGAIEAVDAHFVDRSERGLPSRSIAEAIVRETRSYVSQLRGLGAQAPFVVAVTLTGVRGQHLAVGEQSVLASIRMGSELPTFDRDLIPLPEVIIDPDDGMPWPNRLRPVFDALWQAAGYEASSAFTGKGVWRFDRIE